jgi:hypothetical protein
MSTTRKGIRKTSKKVAKKVETTTAAPSEELTDRLSEDGETDLTKDETHLIEPEIEPQGQPGLREHWEQHQSDVEALEEAPKATPPEDLLAIFRFIIALPVETLEKIMPELLELVSEAYAEKLRTALARIASRCLALIYAVARLEAQGTRRRKMKSNARSKVVEARSLLVAAKHWLGVLEGMGYVSHETADQIRAGRGFMDFALDLVRISEILTDNWEVIGPHQQAQTDEVLRLDRDKVRRMYVFGSWLIVALGGKDQDNPPERGIDWERQVKALWHLLEADYRVIRAAAVFYSLDQGQFSELGSLPTLRGVSRMSRRSYRKSEVETKQIESRDTPKPEGSEEPDEAIGEPIPTAIPG